MQAFDIVKKSDIKNTFRVAKIMADYDVKVDHANEHFRGQIKYPESWQIGLIVGGSGTGKTTIARELYGDLVKDDFEYKASSVIDDMPSDNVDDIQSMFYTVGFGSVPSWLKPYHVLSNGEKMRVDLARKMLTSDFVVFDEFTSVVDRQVAQTMCIAINKAIKRYPEKKFVAISCHFDIADYLQADWVFNTDEMKQVFMTAHNRNKYFQSENVSEASGRSLGVIII